MTYLEEVKGYCSIPSDVVEYDNDLLTTINSALSEVESMGINVINICNDKSVFSDLINGNDYGISIMSFIDEYIKIDCKSIIDPSPNVNVSEAYRKRQDRLLWRIREKSDLMKN